MKRYSSAPCLADLEGESKKIRSVGISEPSTREYLQLALARVLELQREIKEGTYVTQTDITSDLEESSSEEDLTKEVLCKVFQNLPGSPSSVEAVVNKMIKPTKPQLDEINKKRIQLLGYDTCRRTAVEFMKNAARDTRMAPSLKSFQSNYPGFRVGTYSRNEPRIAHRRTGLLLKDFRQRDESSSHDQEIRDRMLRSLDLHLAAKQKDYTIKLMRSEI